MGKLDTPALAVGVMSACGHSWTEFRPPGMELPRDGDLRACCDPDCYPGQFPVTYTEPVEMTGGDYLGEAE